MKRRFILAIMMMMGVMTLRGAIYVDPSATDDSGAGNSWATAKQTLAGALSAVNGSTATTIFMKVGVYNTSSTFTVPSNVTIIGGYTTEMSGTDTTGRLFPGVNANWESGMLCTIIQGSGTHRIAIVNGRMEGCVIRNGFTNQNGGGVLLDGGTLQWCVIKDNTAINDVTYNAKGGGVYVQNNSSLLNCVVCFNRADNGFGVAGSNSTLTNNTITQNHASHCGVVEDYDGNQYSTVVIGEQCWMRENLRTTHFDNGTAISQGVSSYSTPSYFNPHNSTSDMIIYGFYYNWSAASNNQSSTSNPSNIQGVCPTGWHLPSRAEFVQLKEFLSQQTSYCCNNNTDYIAKSLASTTLWNTSTTECDIGNNLQANNISRFTAYPAGYFYNTHQSLNNNTYFWTTDNYNSSNSYHYYLSYSSETLNNNYTEKFRGYSVRCLKNIE